MIHFCGRWNITSKYLVDRILLILCMGLLHGGAPSKSVDEFRNWRNWEVSWRTTCRLQNKETRSIIRNNIYLIYFIILFENAHTMYARARAFLLLSLFIQHHRWYFSIKLPCKPLKIEHLFLSFSSKWIDLKVFFKSVWGVLLCVHRMVLLVKWKETHTNYQ